jgi:hypothetical protein
MRRLRVLFFLGVLICSTMMARAQVDPTYRQLIQLGYNQPMQGSAPLAAYGYYYLNQPNFYRTNYTLRLALAPIYVDAELAFKSLLGENTDLGVGASGGGFADTYSEIRGGRYLRRESFTGHGGSISSSIYHLFNPGSRIPLHGIIRGELHYASYSEDSDTAHSFELPESQPTIHFRTGLRWGGQEPLMLPEVAMELSVWYEGQYRTDAGEYGFDNDRRLEPHSHLFWARALLVYTLPKLKHSFHVSVTAGTGIEQDRFSAYRLGGILPLAAEFPLTLPGYFYQEISAQQFVLAGATYTVPLDQARQWSILGQLTTSVVDYVSGTSQPGNWHSGVGSGIIYRSPSDTWQVMLAYAYGIDAIRNDHRGAHSVGLLLQFDLSRAKLPFQEPGQNPSRSFWLNRFLRLP